MKLFVGINWDEELLNRFDALNQVYAPDIVDEVYGSLSIDPLGQVRESNRLISKSDRELESFIRNAHSKNISVCYVMNSPIITPKQIACKHYEIETFLTKLQSFGIDDYIVASPALARFLRERGEKLSSRQLQPGIIGSTVFDLRTLEQVSEFSSTFDRMCTATDRNRDMGFLEAANMITPIELLVNEMCLFQCPWRNYHYCQEAASALFAGNEIDSVLKDFPVDECWRCFTNNPANILKARWVRPEDIYLYEDIGIKWFKLSGRTMPSEWIFRVVKAYITRKYNGNLLDLFPIVSGSLTKEKQGNKRFYLDNDKINAIGLYLTNSDKGKCFNGCAERSCKTCDSILKRWSDTGVFKEL